MGILKSSESSKSWLARLTGRGRKKEEIFDWDLNPPSAAELAEARAFEERKSERSWAHTQSRRLGAAAVLAAAFLTCEMVFKGLNQDLTRELGPSMQNSLMALSIALGLSLCIFVGFVMAERLSTTMARVSTFVAGWVCVAAFSMWAVGTSSWYAFMSTTGTPALHMYLMDSAARLNKAVEASTVQIKNARGMPKAMEAKAAGFTSRGTAEATTGGATGARGAGPVSQSLDGAAAVLNKGAQGISEAIQKADAQAELMRAKVREISQIVSDRDIPVFQRESAYLKGASEVRAMLGAMNAAGLGEIVASSLAAVKSAVSVMPTDSSKVGARQAAAIQQTREDMEKIASDLEAVLGNLKSVEEQSDKLVETVSLSQVVWNYKENFKPALILAIGIDLFAAWALIILGLHGLEEVKRREKREARVRSFLELDAVVGPALSNPDAVKALRIPSVVADDIEAEPVEDGRKGQKRKRETV